MDAPARLLQASDPAPFELVNAASDSDVVIVCEHAGRDIPALLGTLGLTGDQLDRHIAFDIGAETVARLMSARLDTPLILQPYSRLVIDCNRPVAAEDSIPEISDQVAVPGNKNLTETDRRQRIDEIFTPFQDAVSGLLDRHARRAIFAIHSFTPMLGDSARPWDIAFLFRQDTATSQALANTIRRCSPDVVIGMNEPYCIDDRSDWFVPYHGERRGLAHSLIEIRNDHLLSDDGCRYWASLIGDAISEFQDNK